jgi:hypothetical protein
MAPTSRGPARTPWRAGSPRVVPLGLQSSLVGAVAGGVLGTVVGTVAVPLFGAVIGGVVGTAVGDLLGLLNALVLAGLDRCTPIGMVQAGVVAALTSAVAASLLALAVTRSGPVAVAAVPVAGGLGAVLGPVALRRAGLVDRSRPCRYAGFGATGFAVIGGAVGLVVGLVSYPPTAAFAFVEAAVLAAFPGVVAGAFVGMFVDAFVRSPHPSAGSG